MQDNICRLKDKMSGTTEHFLSELNPLTHWFALTSVSATLILGSILYSFCNYIDLAKIHSASQVYVMLAGSTPLRCTRPQTATCGASHLQ
jgi:hypothetical protein